MEKVTHDLYGVLVPRVTPHRQMCCRWISRDIDVERQVPESPPAFTTFVMFRQLLVKQFSGQGGFSIAPRYLCFINPAIGDQGVMQRPARLAGKATGDNLHTALGLDLIRFFLAIVHLSQATFLRPLPEQDLTEHRDIPDDSPISLPVERIECFLLQVSLGLFQLNLRCLAFEPLVRFVKIGGRAEMFQVSLSGRAGGGGLFIKYRGTLVVKIGKDARNRVGKSVAKAFALTGSFGRSSGRR